MSFIKKSFGFQFSIGLIWAFIPLLILFSCVHRDISNNKDNILISHPIKTLHVNESHSKIIIDGDINEKEWSEAVKLTPFMRTAGEIGEEVEFNTECYAVFDQKYLYLSFICEEPEVKNLKSNAAYRDDPDIIYDDRVSVFIDPTHNHRDYVELTVNPLGVQFDQKIFRRYPYTRTDDRDLSWNGEWSVSIQILDNKWIAELQIDARSFDIDQIEEGLTWGFNVTRARKPSIHKGDDHRNKKPANGAEYSAWSEVHDGLWETVSNFYEPIEFGDLIFGSGELLVESIDFKDADFRMGQRTIPSTFGWNPLEIKFKENQNLQEKVILRLTVEPSTMGEWESEIEMNLRKGSVVRANYFIQEDKENKLTIEFLEVDSGKSLYKTSYALTVPPLIDFNLSSLYLKNIPEEIPVKYRLVVDESTRSICELKICLIDSETGNQLDSVLIEDLSNADEFSPVFNVHKLRQLPGKNYVFKSGLFEKKSGKLMGSFDQPFTKYSLDSCKSFMVAEEEYNYGGLSGHSARISYPSGAEFVFWKKANYIPWWDIGQAVVSAEFIEAWHSDYQGCCEPMQDRECRYSQIEILENSPARAVVHWRYALNDAHYKIYKGEWVDEYYRFYPDGVGVREINLWANSSDKHEIFEVILVNPPALETCDMLDEPYANLHYLDGKGYSTSDFQKNGKKFFHDFVEQGKDFVFELNFKDRLNPFFVFSVNDSLLPGLKQEDIAVGSFNYESTNHRQHWPASLYAVDGYNGIGNNRPTHGALGNIHISRVDSVNNPNRFTLLLGVNEDNSGMAQLHGQSWLYPANIESQSDFKCQGYDSNQRAYLLESDKNEFEFRFNPVHNSILNPVFIINGRAGFNYVVTVDNKELGGNDVIEGDSKDGDRVIFINKNIQKEVVFTIKSK